MTEQYSVLFICLGNICRSAIAEALFIRAASERGVLNQWKIDSAATSTYQIGNPPDPRTMAVLVRNNVHNYSHIAKQIRKEDYNTFKYILGMDESNIRNLQQIAPKNSSATIELLGSYDPHGETIIQDPYYSTSNKAFDEVYEQCLRSCKAFLDHAMSKQL